MSGNKYIDHSGGSRISRWGGAEPLEGGANLRCGCFLVKTCENERIGSCWGRAPAALPGSANGSLRLQPSSRPSIHELLEKMNNTIVQLTNENVVIKDENRSLKERLIKLEYHQRCNNLVFDGFPEQHNETDTDCYNLVRDALSHLFSDDNTPGGQSKIDKANNITINRAHRNGRFIPGRNRSIIINLQWYGDKEYIISNRRSLPTGIYVNEDFPYEILQHRNILRPILKLQGRIQDLIRGGAQIMTGLKLPFWGLSFVEFWCWGLIFGGQGGPGPLGPPLDPPLNLVYSKNTIRERLNSLMID